MTTINAARAYIARIFITIGIMILPADVRSMMRGILLYHVPGVLSEAEKAEVRAAKAEWERARR